MTINNENQETSDAPVNSDLFVLTNEKLTKIFFDQFSGVLANIPFVKFIIDRQDANKIYFLNDRFYPLHAYFVADHLVNEKHEVFFKKIDSFNELNYHSNERRFFFGTIGRIKKENKYIYLLETQEIDSMGKDLIEDLFSIVKKNIDPNFDLIFKPANHFQENSVKNISVKTIPRMLTSEIYATSNFISLNTGVSVGRLRCFFTEEEFHKAQKTIEWYDIVVMDRVPDDVPRVSGMINAQFTTPLSHTNVLASGWKIPNCIQKNIFEKIKQENLDSHWVRYEVSSSATQALLNITEIPKELKKPNWAMQAIVLENPDVEDTKICSLSDLRMTDRYKYGTKAANIGEMKHIIENGSNRILGFYQVKRPPRENLIPHLANFLGVSEKADIQKEAFDFLSTLVKVPNGIAIPFSIQRQFLETSPQIQQAIGKLKMALELDAHEIDSLCISLQNLILKTRIPDRIRDEIDKMIINELAGVSTFVVRSSSNAEDLENFSAAGIYESVNHINSSEKIFDAIKLVWASLVSARSVRLRQQSGISLDQSYMGVIIQEEVSTGMGGVMVTTNPMDKKDFRNTYINVSLKSVINIVSGAELPMQYLFNTVESGGYTLSLGSASEDLPEDKRLMLQKMAYAGRLMQSHFSPDYTFSNPVDIEWLVNKQGLYFLQLRPYSK
jgi:phosphoenolpyruvate synthase/pyruvate phosphate dikinase